MSIPPDLRAVLVARRKADRQARIRPCAADLELPGPDLSPAALAGILGISREYVAMMLRDGSIPATYEKRVGRKLGRWRTSRAVALSFVRKLTAA